MRTLAAKYRSQGLEILCFPCNQYGAQEPWEEAKIKAFVHNDMKCPDVQLFSKINVKGANTHPVYQFLLGAFPGVIGWNFASKFVTDRNGVPVARFENADWATIEERIVAELNKEALPASM